MADFDIHAVFQVGDRSAHLQNFIVGAGGKAKPFDRDFQQVLRFVVDLAEMTDIPCFQVRVAVNLFPLFITLKLPITRLVDASADRGRGFARLGRLQFVVFQGRHFNVNVDAVEERSGQFRPVVLDLQRRAPAFMVGIGEIAAGAGVHGRGEHETRGIGQGNLGPADRHKTVFQRLAQDLDDVLVEFGQFVEKEHAVVGERNLARFGYVTAADNAGVRNRMVGRAEGTGRDQGFAGRQGAGNRMDLGRFQRLLHRHLGQDRDDATGEHGLARARWSDHQDVMAAGRGDLQGALGVVLALHLGEIERILGRRVEDPVAVHADRLDFDLAVQEGDDFDQIVKGVDLDVLDDRRLAAVQLGDDDPVQAVCPGGQGDRDRAFDRPQGTVQGELAEDRVPSQTRGTNRRDGAQDADRDRQVKTRSFFFDVRRRQVDRDLLRREAEPGILDRGGYPVLGFLDRVVGQAHGRELRQAVGQIDLDVDEIAVDAERGAGNDFGEH